jgi:hypothetical protein
MYSRENLNKEHLTILRQSDKKANAILNKLKKRIATKGYCENLGQKELREYSDWLRGLNLSYNVYCQHKNYLSNAIDSL